RCGPYPVRIQTGVPIVLGKSKTSWQRKSLLAVALPVAAVGLLLHAPSARAQNIFTWQGAQAAPNWSIPTNWNPSVGAPPQTANDIALFANAGSIQPSVDLPFTIQQLQFAANAQGYVFGGGAPLTLSPGAGGTGLLDKSIQNQQFFNDFTLATSQTWNIAAAQETAQFLGLIGGTGSKLTK